MEAGRSPQRDTALRHPDRHPVHPLHHPAITAPLEFLTMPTVSNTITQESQPSDRLNLYNSSSTPAK